MLLLITLWRLGPRTESCGLNLHNSVILKELSWADVDRIKLLQTRKVKMGVDYKFSTMCINIHDVI